MTHSVVYGSLGLAEAEDRRALLRPGGGHGFPSRPDAIVPVFHARPANYREGPMKDLIAIVRAVRLDRTLRPWWLLFANYPRPKQIIKKP